ncbi:hypothetical protein K438DRAFT_274357 [Mycena galopus ATCC 62051]|nr:hypothetical protein K438DRAFT_274357 [Mycena galopus ATCC 62051]
MAVPPLSIRAVLLEQTERTRQSSKSDIALFLEESELKITSLESQTSTPPVELLDRERACVAALRHILASIHALPVELLAEIFELAIENLSHIKDTFRVSQVCVDWRQVAHGTLHLWARRLRVNLKRDYSEVYADGLKAWLARSAPLPIDISFEMGSSMNITRRLWEDVSIIAPRCRSLQLKGWRRPSHQLVIGLAQSGLNILEELDLGNIDVIDEIDGGIDFSALPRLRQLMIRIDSDFSQILMPWAQLTELTLTVGLPGTALDILPQCTNLIRASITTRGWDVPPQGRNIITLTRLRTLSLDFFGNARDVTLFLHYISAPALEELCIDAAGMEPGVAGWTEAYFTAFQLLAPHLTRLRFDGLNITSDDLRAAILHAPSLTRLEIISCHRCFDDAVMVALLSPSACTIRSWMAEAETLNLRKTFWRV